MVDPLVTFGQALNIVLHQLMDADDTLVCIGEDIGPAGGPFGVTAGLFDTFGPTRVIETPISETAFVGMGVGAALTGLKPVVEVMFCDFVGVCFDQILNQAAKARYLSNGRLALPLVIRTTMGAGDGSGAMHSASLHGMLASIAGLTVVCPSNPLDAAGLLKSAILSEGPVIFFEHKNLYTVPVPMVDDFPAVPLGKARILREGNDVTLVATGQLVAVAESACSALAGRSVSIELIDPRTIKPLDICAILASVRKTGRLLVVDEGPAFSGFADAVIGAVVEQGFDVLKSAPQKLCPPDTPVPYAPDAEQKWLPGRDAIAHSVTAMMEG